MLILAPSLMVLMPVFQVVALTSPRLVGKGEGGLLAKRPIDEHIVKPFAGSVSRVSHSLMDT